ncbi:radical SAM protein [Piscirickettsia litoralis]|uniref:radical SAM protein n=1 Tax=Piscirickettsia litoralis TaxID=1891921 RepID=UPI000AEE8E59|nr:radical SAM protein [Piscirickettsia litoralis]
MKFELKWLAWEITRRCNLSCVHCRSSSCLEVATADVKKQQGFEILEQIAKFGPISVVLSGGEPLLHPDVFEFADYGHRLGLRMCLASNGTLITPKIAEKIKQAKINMVALSLDGATAKTHDLFRNQQGAFSGTLAAAKTLQRQGIPFLVNSSFTKQNQHEISEVYQVAKSLGAKAWYLFMVVPTGRGENLFSDLISTESYDEILKWHYEMEQDEDEMFVRPTCAPHYYRIRFQQAKARGKAIKKKVINALYGGRQRMLSWSKNLRYRC